MPAIRNITKPKAERMSKARLMVALRPNAKTQRRRASEPQVQTGRPTHRPLEVTLIGAFISLYFDLGANSPEYFGGRISLRPRNASEHRLWNALDHRLGSGQADARFHLTHCLNERYLLVRWR